MLQCCFLGMRCALGCICAWFLPSMLKLLPEENVGLIVNVQLQLELSRVSTEGPAM